MKREEQWFQFFEMTLYKLQSKNAQRKTQYNHQLDCTICYRIFGNDHSSRVRARLSGISFGSSPVLHHNYVEHLLPDNITLIQKVVIALAGPILSLFQGILAGTAYFKAKSHNLKTLFLFWFSILGLNNFLGYLMMGFLFQQGDIGKVFQLLDASLFIEIFISELAALTLLFIAY